MGEKEEAKVWISGEDILKKFDEFDTFYEEHSEEIRALETQVSKLRLDIWELEYKNPRNHHRLGYYYGGRESRIDHVMDTMITFRSLFSQSVDGKVLVTNAHLDAIKRVNKSVVEYHIKELTNTIVYLTKKLDQMKGVEVMEVEKPKVLPLPELADPEPPYALIAGMVIIVIILIATFSN